ncbi:MAG: type II toxin-antitoxin system VapC family toxin [Ginsengibacter sp.]
MKILLDTHIIIWVTEANSSLSAKHSAIISDTKNEKFVSEFSFIELAIKIDIGKLPHFKMPIGKFIEQVQSDGFKILPDNNKYLDEFVKLPLMKDHYDPFDRLIISAAISENMSIITVDNKFRLYKKLVDLI